tara:strand:+ start:721 stop:909 length:189 start_codon:yes stop_codon:yes gene_type:complete
MTLFEIFALVLLTAILFGICKLISPDSEFVEFFHAAVFIALGICLVGGLMWLFEMDIRFGRF